MMTILLAHLEAERPHFKVEFLIQKEWYKLWFRYSYN